MVSTPLANQLLAWRLEIAVAGGYLQEFYRSFDRKQWDRAERVCRKSCELIARNHPESASTVREGIEDLRSRGVTDDCLVEQEAWRRVIEALMCLASLFSMVETWDRSIRGFQGMRTDATRSLGMALQASNTAFPEVTLRALAEQALHDALRSTERILSEDLRDSGASYEMEPDLLARAARDSCEAALRRVVEEYLGSQP
ncbi:hypothetical protein [Geothrix sp. PMB-07]|uniref:hypothetical protein n=1 Tax=Geothrix sp. PMB-07 TaxID=3068640 RepID=UPI0027419310|nr:hypothetical protein [Geothrix sp. PMB-07]WLT30899.1 hypothetical protein Q9293_14360 [Geothrix sp. PMB-07]